MLAKERATDMYRLSAYFMSRSLSDLPMEWLLPTLFLCIVYFMAGLRQSAAAFFCTLLSIYLIITTAQVRLQYARRTVSRCLSSLLRSASSLWRHSCASRHPGSQNLLC